MPSAGFIWECECGNIEYGNFPPEECRKCFKLESFTQLPEEIAEEREKEMFIDLEKILKKPKSKGRKK